MLNMFKQHKTETLK